ncbi:DUF917 domain-containing protein [Amycolatopsis acidiphila]|uniref:DUF917 domain-containing protein n=1 Tax=Amycolatopsis acidiphila TaxID=715473 RepID=A0A558AAD6_9PSEU|nr:DUF917 domain-containing protein [Amycolatopsis acidiphila]TVT21230.1 DUF917 domain-containing protein [Amycolatopsis acidiphila]UIJ61247.1 DUF917 domain-containing protein [Amycolatopsis acidiphila]GHG78598.1 hypothetical protein GCM10017788_45990 [Amycolatopsis acidiphila]
MKITAQDVPALERGVALLGSGGGGDTITAAALLRKRLPAAVTPVGDLPPEAKVVPVGVVGATAVFTEKLPGGDEVATAVAAIERWTAERADALISIEVGGLNGLLPIVAAHELGLSVVDADLSGRGLPRLDQLSVATVGRGLAPAVVAEPSGQVLVLATGSDATIERTARAFLASSSGWAILALAPIPASALPAAAVLDTVSGALELGRRVLALGESPDPAALAAAIRGEVLATGRVLEVSRRVGPGEHGRPGFGRGSVTLTDHRDGSLLRLEMENEYLLALRDGHAVASTPDVLTVADRRTCVPISCDAIREGVEVAVLRLPAASFWTDPRHLPVLGPRAFGIDTEPVLR